MALIQQSEKNSEESNSTVADNPLYLKLQGLIAKKVYDEDDIGDVEFADIEVISRTLDAIWPEIEKLYEERCDYDCDSCRG